MARRRKSRARKPRPPRGPAEPEDVLEGRVEARLEDLFDLIHRVNPTGEDLPAREAARRYAQKSGLQSLLIRRFGDRHLTVTATENEGVVSLDHRSGARDACHAVVDELEPDARSWVRRQLDLAAFGDPDEVAEGPSGGPANGGEAGGEEVEELLQRGRRLLEEFDYEGGEELLERAFASAPPGTAQAVAAAEALLELQVDTLGMDPAALELEPRLDPKVREHPAVRALLALAAARLGDAERALRLIEGGPSLPRTAEVYAALTAGAIRDHDREAAERFLDRLAELDDIHPQILRLRDEIAGLRAEDFQAVEAELERRFRAGGAAAVEDQARALADRWPEGEVARRILRQAATERREAEIAEHLEQAEKARAAERYADAERHFQAAIDAGSERQDLPARAAEVRGLARRERRRAAIASVAGRFADPAPQGALPAAGDEDRRQAFLAYLALAEGARARVRGEVTEPALGWLDELDPPRSGSQARPLGGRGGDLQAAVTAVLALERAAAALAADDAQAAVDELEAQRTTLRQVERARSLWREAHQRLEEERRRRGREALGLARAALDQGRTAEARRLLDNLPRADLADRDRARAEDLGSEIGSAEALERLARQVRERRAAGDLAGALTRARVLAQRTRDRCGSPPRSPGERDPADRWSRRLAELQGLLRTAWELEVVTEEVPVEETPPPSHWREKSVVWLDGEGRELVLANAWDRWLFLSLVDVRRSRVTARVSLKTPRPLEAPLLTRRHGSRLWITGRGGDMVELERDGWDILGYYPLDELVTGGRSLDGVVPLPGGPWVWMHVKGEGGGDVTWVADRAEHRVVHRLTDGLTSFAPILGGGEPRVLRSGPRLAARLFTVAGEPASSESLVRGYVADADLGPDGRGLLLLAHRDPGPVAVADAGGESEDKGRELVRFVESPPGGTLVRSAGFELPGVNPFGFPAVVTAPELGRTFVLIYTNDHHSELLIFSEPSADQSDRLQPVFRTRCPGQATLVHDLQVRRIAAMTFVGGDVQLRFLDSDEPTLAGMGKKRSPKGWPYPRPTIFANVCDQPTGAVDAAVDELVDELLGRDAKALRTHLARTEIRATASADDIVLVALALLRLEHRDKVYGIRQTVEELARRLARKHPRHAGVQLLLANFEAREERWEEVGRLLGGASAAGLDAGRACHFHHLEGLAHFHAGRLDEAYEAFRRGVDHSEGKCGLEPLRDLTQPMESPPREDEWAPDQPLVRRLAGALRTADFALTAGDPETARRALDRQDVRWEVDLQLTARRASAYLEATAATAVERFHERAALSFYLHVRRQDQYMRRNLFLPGLHWDEERLAAVEAQARARLEKLGEP